MQARGPNYQATEIAQGWKWFEYPGAKGTFCIQNSRRRAVAKCNPQEGWFRYLYGRAPEEEAIAYKIALVECRCPESAIIQKQEEMPA
jgi:hypothetical protein